MPTSSVSLDSITDLDDGLVRHYKKKLAVLPFLTRRIVSFQANRNKPCYRWYKFKESFSADLVEYLLKEYKIKGKILDPFAGVGTSLFAASRLGIVSDGIELLPVAQEIIGARLTLQEGMSNAERTTLKHWADACPWKHCKARLSLNVLRITQGAYPSVTVDAIERYLTAIQVESSKIIAILKFALLCVLESVSYTRKDGQYLHWDYRARKRATSFDKGTIVEFAPAIGAKIYEILSDTMLTSHDSNLLATSNITLQGGSCLDIMPKLPSNSYDAVITSPPYCNRYDYTRTYALELALLGLNDAEVIALRQKMLSCTVENRHKNLQNNDYIKFTKISDSEELLAIILRQLETAKKRGNLNNNG